MAFDWQHYLEFARFLQTQTGAPYQEAALRTAVSRSYYAAFGHAHEYACDYLGFTPRRKPEEKSQDHGRLRAQGCRAAPAGGGVEVGVQRVEEGLVVGVVGGEAVLAIVFLRLEIVALAQ